MTSKTKKSAGGLFIFQHGTREYVAMGSEAGTECRMTWPVARIVVGAPAEWTRGKLIPQVYGQSSLPHTVGGSRVTAWMCWRSAGMKWESIASSASTAACPMQSIDKPVA